MKTFIPDRRGIRAIRRHIPDHHLTQVFTFVRVTNVLNLPVHLLQDKKQKGLLNQSGASRIRGLLFLVDVETLLTTVTVRQDLSQARHLRDHEWSI